VEQSPVVKVVKKLPVIYGNRRFILILATFLYYIFLRSGVEIVTYAIYDYFDRKISSMLPPRTSETLISYHNTTLLRNSENLDLKRDCRESLKTRITRVFCLIHYFFTLPIKISTRPIISYIVVCYNVL
jgi:hypothetical protein